MKVSKTILAISFIIFIVLIILVGRFAYSIGQHDASLTVKEATPMQLARAMQSDNFYGAYTQTMLLVSGQVKSVTQRNTDTLVQFEVTTSPSALGNVSCNIKNNQTKIKAGNTVRVLTVAYDAKRQHTADVFMPNCYLLKK